MEILKQPPTGKGPAEWFAGDVWFDVIYRGVEPSRARANMVRFAPGARTAWHSHGLGQTLYIVEGMNTWLEHVTDAEYSGPRVSTRH